MVEFSTAAAAAAAAAPWSAIKVRIWAELPLLQVSTINFMSFSMDGWNPDRCMELLRGAGWNRTWLSMAKLTGS
jgi:hypothetical protein